MAKPINELRKQLKPEIQQAAREKALDIITEMSLAETRKARGFSQAQIAENMSIAQPNVSQIESRPDTLVSTLNFYIKALGGELELRAKFPDGQNIAIKQFSSSSSEE